MKYIKDLFFKKYNILQTIYWKFRLKLFSEATIRIFPRTIVDIHRGAIVKINKGKLSINRSWFSTRYRRYTSELRVLNNGSLILNGNFDVYQGASMHVGENASLVLHGASFINTNSTINCFCHIEIGVGCAISDNVCITDSDSHSIDGRNMQAPIYIKDHVWIGKNSIILKGVIIGEGAIIGAGSVVTKSIPDRCLAVGNPARVIKENITWSL